MSAQICTSPASPFGRLDTQPYSPSPDVQDTALTPQPAALELAQAPDQSLLARIWLAFCKRRNEVQLRNLAKEMDPHMLADVGAPSWLVNECSLQRDLARLRNADYLRW